VEQATAEIDVTDLEAGNLADPQCRGGKDRDDITP
jgi:hypothetical protein